MSLKTSTVLSKEKKEHGSKHSIELKTIHPKATDRSNIFRIMNREWEHKYIKTYDIPRDGHVVHNITLKTPYNYDRITVTLRISGSDVWSCTTISEQVIIPWSINLIAIGDCHSVNVIVHSHLNEEFGEQYPNLTAEYILFQDPEYIQKHPTQFEKRSKGKYWWVWNSHP